MKTYGPIQVQPAGWLSLLDLKDRGKFPAEVLDTVTPTIEMRGFWLRQKSETLGAGDETIATAASEFIELFSVPNNEWWYVHYALGGILADTDGAVGRVSLQANSPGGAGPAIYVWPDFINDVTLGSNVPLWTPVEDFWMPPGSNLILEGFGLAIGTTSLRRNGAMVTRLRV